MNSQEAKYILQGFRSEERERDDPRMREALEQVRRDPELEKWFKQEMEWDQTMRESLKGVAVPAELKSQILAARRMSEPDRWAYRRAWIAAAAAVMLFIGSGLFLFPNDEVRSLESYRSAMTRFLAETDQAIQFHSTRMEDVRGYLSSQNAASSFELPSSLTSLRSLGCRVLDWHGLRISLLCFLDEEKKVWHLFVVDRSALHLSHRLDFPFLTKEGSYLTAAWREGNHLFLLVGNGDELDFRRLL